MKLEKTYYKAVGEYYERTANNTTVWEVKRTTTNSLPFSALMDHQERYLTKATERYSKKYADVGLARKPFDGTTYIGAYSYVVIVFGSLNVYEIPIHKFIREKYTSKRKSLTEKRAGQIGQLIKL